MATLRIRVEIDRGRERLPLSRIAGFTEKLAGLLEALGEESGFSADENEWQASHFKDGSLQLTAEPRFEIAPEAARAFTAKTTALLSGSLAAVADAEVTVEAADQFLEVARALEPGREVRIGVYSSEKATRPRWRPISPEFAVMLARSTPRPMAYVGSVQGIIVSLFKEGDSPHFWLRDVATSRRVQCYYQRSMYSLVTDALADQDAVVHVRGRIQVDDRRERKLRMAVEKIRLAVAPGGRDDVVRLFGIAPDLTEDMSTSDFLQRLREDERH